MIQLAEEKKPTIHFENGRTFLNLKAESLCEEKEIRTELFTTHWNILHVKILSKRGILRLKTSLFLS